MFSREYLQKLSKTTGFRPDSLQKQITLLDLLREINRHPLLSKQFALKGGTAINLFWFPLPRLSVDIDLNYIASPDRDEMLRERPRLENELKKLIQSRGISVENAPADEHAGAKWRLRAPNAFGGNFNLEVDLNYLMRIPIWGVTKKRPFIIDEDYLFDCNTISIEELFAGKIKALFDRSAARDLFDVFQLSTGSCPCDPAKLRKAVILFGITCNEDWRKKDYKTIEEIDQKMIDEQLIPLLRSREPIDMATIKSSTLSFLSRILLYEDREILFMERFYEEGKYQPELIFDDETLASQLAHHPAVLWKLQHHRKHFGL